ncbi:MAG: hypothetical protein IPF57_14530 [Gammaproteobacteria bacterium]|nr:hypothetical protein [Gammaproteobacteria bacterium]
MIDTDVEALRASTELQALELGNDQLQVLDLAALRGNDRLERGGVIGVVSAARVMRAF